METVAKRRIHDFRNNSQMGYTTIRISWLTRQNAVDWCKEQFGEPNHTTESARWNYGLDEFWFNEEKDAVLFALKWA